MVRKLSDTNYAVKRPGRRKEVRIFHSNFMKPYRQREAVINLALNRPEVVQADVPVLCNEKDSDFLERKLKRAEQETELECAQ